MSSSVLRICLVSCIALFAVAANAQGKPPDPFEPVGAPKSMTAQPAAPQPAPELTSFMRDMLGTWNCTSTFPAGSMGPGSPEMKSTAKVKFSKEPALAGFFYRGDYSLPKSKTMPMSMAGVFYVGYESMSKQIISLGVDSMGTASMGMGPLSETSMSWTGDGYMMGQKVKLRETMTKVAPKQVTHTMEVDMGKGFQKMGEDVCKK